MLGWLCICAIVVVCCRCVLHRLCSTTCMRPCIKPLGVLSRHPCRIPKPLSPVKGCICLVGFASLQSPLAYTPGIHAGAERGATAPSPSKDACSQPHKATMQGRIMTATQSRYARMHKDSHTKPLHDATAQMAVDAQTQRHKWLSAQGRTDPNDRKRKDA